MDSGIENQIMMQKMTRVQVECGVCKKYIKEDLKLRTSLPKERSIKEIKRNFIYMMIEFSKITVASIVMSKDSE